MSQIATSSWGERRKLPYAFFEMGWRAMESDCHYALKRP